MMRRTFLVLGAILLLLGCAEKRELVKRPPFRPVIAPPSEPLSEGSLWREGERSLFLDHKARQVGDIVTVKIVEVNTAQNSAKTETSRSSEVDAGVTTFLNAPLHFGLDKIWSGGFRPELKSSIDMDFEGEGTTSRSTRFLATISCQVVEVLPNGNLVIEGWREVKINREREYIMLKGVVRPEDIGADNTVLSTALANAQIEYSGKGVVSDKQGPGFLTRILDLIWPF